MALLAASPHSVKDMCVSLDILFKFDQYENVKITTGYEVTEARQDDFFLRGLSQVPGVFARWISRDPLGEQGGINLYGYVGNNPISGIDLLGLFSGLNLSGNLDVYAIPTDYFSYQVGGAHGDNQSINGFSTLYGNYTQSLTANDVAQIITSDPNYIPKTPVSLFSCDTGNGSNSLAQQLAIILGALVTAPNNDLFTNSYGDYGVGPGDAAGRPYSESPAFLARYGAFSPNAPNFPAATGAGMVTYFPTTYIHH